MRRSWEKAEAAVQSWVQEAEAQSWAPGSWAGEPEPGAQGSWEQRYGKVPVQGVRISQVPEGLSF